MSGAMLSTSYAQSAYDAFKYGNTQSQGTARGIGIGGALGSVGGDASSFSVNPAGIGVYRSSELTITPALQFSSGSSNYLGESTGANSSRLVLGNASYVTTYRAEGRNYEQSKLKTLSLGLTYNRVADFNQKTMFSGLNNESSIVDVFSADAINYGTDPNIQPPLGYLGYEGFLLYDDLTSIPTHTILDNGGSLRQSQETRANGGINEFGINVGGNVNETVLFGVGLNFLDYKYDHISRFVEEDATGNFDNDFNSLIYTEDLETRGIGFNMKFGAIIIPHESFRIGLAVHTPTWSNFTDMSHYNLLTDTENLKRDTGQPSSNPMTNVTPDYPYEFSYNLRTPWKAVLSGTALFGKSGFLTVDYEFVDYTSMKYSGDIHNSSYFSSVNTAIKDMYRGAHNIRVGGEARLDQFLIRAGFGYSSNPFEENSIYDGSKMHYAAGIGYRAKGFGIDLGYMLMNSQPQAYGYPLIASGVPVGIVDTDLYKSLVSLSLSFRF